MILLIVRLSMMCICRGFVITVSKIINDFVEYSLVTDTSRPAQSVVVGIEDTRHISVWQPHLNKSNKSTLNNFDGCLILFCIAVFFSLSISFAV